MNNLRKALAGVFAATAVVSGTSIAQVIYDSTPRYVQRNPAYVGTIESIDVVRAREGNRAAGTILGGVVGGVIGHQFGSGRGNDAATVAGALGGAAVGHEIAENRSGRDGYRVNVRLDNGGLRTFFEDNVYGLNVGDRVQIDSNDHLYRFAASDDRNYRVEGYRSDPNGYRVAADEPPVRYLPNGRLDRRVYQYDSQGYRVDQWGNRYDAEGYWVDELGKRHEYQDPPMNDAGVPQRPPQQ
jgi:uncharacterized protein YcfJ